MKTTTKSKVINNLSKQVYIPSIDTFFFFNEQEQALQNRIFDMYNFIEMNKKLIKEDKKKYEYLKNTNKSIKNKIAKANRVMPRVIKYNKHQRELTGEIKPKHMVGMFESTLSRTIGMKHDEPSNDLIIVEIFHNEMLRQLIRDGFTYQGETYRYFSSSSGQIKTRKCVFIKDKLWDKYQFKLMCGLTVDGINKRGGINPNKLLSYLMLNNSATTKWNIDLNRIIVINDMETVVEGKVDYVDDETFEVKKEERSVTITQTDGVGFCLPSISDKAFMFRGPWMKGLIVPVPFDLYKGKTTKVIDYWGKEWDVVEDGIQIILHKSQVKLADYYDSWQDFKDKFKQHKCEMSIGNVEDEYFKDATLTYQMLQSITDISEEEIIELTKTTRNKIELVGRDKDIMFDIMGVTQSNRKKNYLQQAIEIYPNLMSDNYVKEVITEIKRSMVKDAKGGKIEIPNAKYTYVVPDVVAWMDWVFNGNSNPKGILENEKVSCKLYDNGKRLNCLRNPHLFREHGLRDNVVNKETDKWFITNCIYVSIDSLLSKLLQYDCDGDKLLISDNKTLIQVAERNMQGIVPLVYNMRSGKKQIINNEVIYDSLMAGFSANIGEISNAISRAWHMDEVDDEVMKDIKRLCALNNQEIDYSKTLWRSENIPEQIEQRLSKYQRGKLPHVFHYAKGKKKKSVKKAGMYLSTENPAT